MKLYKIHKWSEVFENADSRKRVRLGYYYMPSGCDSSGYLGLMSEFEPAEAWQAYGIFVALCQHAATMDKEVRGSFLNSDGTPMSVRRLALIIRADVGILERSLEILMHQSVKWVSAEDVPVTCQSPADHVPENSGFVQGQGQGQGQGQDTMSDEAPPAEDSVLELIEEEIETGPTIEEEAERVWKAYPAKAAKAKTMPHVVRAVKAHGADWLIDYIERYAAACHAIGRSMKNGDTFFRNDAYEDDIPIIPLTPAEIRQRNALNSRCF